MHRRPLGRGRRLAALAAAVIILGCLLPWAQVGGGTDLPLRSENAFVGGGILVFFAALATIALFTLPYATERPVAIDRALSYVALVIVGWIGLAVRVVELVAVNVTIESILPQRAPGLWLAALGLIVLSRATYEIAREPAYR
jgi:hypothetical protein